MKQYFGRCFAEQNENKMSVGNEGFTMSLFATDCGMDDANGHSRPHLRTSAKTPWGDVVCRVWDDMSAIEYDRMPKPFTMKLEGEHWVCRAVRFYACTDYHDSYVQTKEYPMFRRDVGEPIYRTVDPIEGNIFFLEDMQSGRAVVLISLNPDFVTATLVVKGGEVTLDTKTYGMVYGECRVGECEALCRNWYRHAWRCTELHTMSNTWGDLNAFNCVSEDFVRRELDAAEQLGLDIVQIDDGWQKGSTADKTLRISDGRRIFPGDFWEIKKEKFPNGIKPLMDYAKEKGLRLGVWFAPHSHRDFEYINRDIAVLKKAHDEWGAKYFKLDMIFIETYKARDRMVQLLDAIYSFGEGVSVELDVTNGTRMGFLGAARYGTLFMENRYSGTANLYYPHRVLRNQWKLAPYLPTAKFQFELLNPDLRRASYAEDDPFAPATYDMDYLFATVMFTNPLFWMEVQFLSEHRRAQLKDVMSVWKAHRDRLVKADVTPIGEQPSGRSVTGFCAVCDDGHGDTAYAVVFREVTDRETAALTLPFAATQVELLASNAEAKLSVAGNTLTITVGKERAYAFVKLTK